MLRLAKNRNLPVSSILSFRRNYAADELNFGSVEIPSKPKFVPSGGASFVQNVDNPTCDMHVSGRWLYGFRYHYIIYKALQIEGSKALEAGANARKLKVGFEEAYSNILWSLRDTARKISTHKEISQVAVVAANGDTELGNFIAEGLCKVDKDSDCSVTKNDKMKNEVEFIKSLHLRDWDISSHYFLTDKRKRTCLLKNPYILFVNKILNKSVVQAIQQAMRPTTYSQPRPLLIIAENVEKGVEVSLMPDRSCPRKKICVVTPQKYLLDGRTSRAMMEDLAIFTGGQVVTGESDMNFTPEVLGSCKKFTMSSISSQATMTMSIYDAAGNEKDIEKRLEQLRTEMELNSQAHYLGDRLRCLLPAIKFKVGGATDPDKVSAVIQATKKALDCGILPGRGVALLNAAKNLEKLQLKDPDAMLGVQLLKNALKMPVYCIASSAGFDGSAIVERLMEQDNPYLGYDPTTGEYLEMFESGNIDILGILNKELDQSVSDFIASVLNGEFYDTPRIENPFRDFYNVPASVIHSDNFCESWFRFKCQTDLW